MGMRYIPGFWKVQTVAQLLNFGITPFIAFIISKIFFPENQYLALGLLLTGLLPTSGMTIYWTGMAKGNMIVAMGGGKEKHIDDEKSTEAISCNPAGQAHF